MGSSDAQAACFARAICLSRAKLHSALPAVFSLAQAFRTVWPSGLRRWLQAPVRKGVGSNPTAVTCLVCLGARAKSRRGVGPARLRDVVNARRVSLIRASAESGPKAGKGEARAREIERARS